MRAAISIAVFLSVVFALTLANSQGPRRGELFWSDEFDGNKIDTSKWYFQIGDGSNTTAGPVRTRCFSFNLLRYCLTYYI